MNESPQRALASGDSYTLRDGGYSAVIASIGASLRSLRYENADLVVPFEPDEVRPVYRGAILAPWPNRVVDGRYRDGGGEHQLALSEPERGHALHGLMVWYDFQPVEASENQVILRGEVVPQQGYPHRVRVDVRYHLDDQGLSCEVRGINVGSTRAPWGTGPHPYLRAGSGHVDDWTLHLPAGQVLEVTPDRLIPLQPVPVEEFEDGALDFRRARLIGDTFIDHAFTNLSRDDDGWVRVTVTAASGRGVAIVWDDTCAWVQVHTADRPDPAQHRVGLAVEPMTCAPDAYNNGWGLVQLEPGESHVARWRITTL